MGKVAEGKNWEIEKQMDEELNKKRMKECNSGKGEEISITCPYCGTTITLESIPFQKIVLICPICNKEGIVSSKEMKELRTRKMKKKEDILKKSETYFPKNQNQLYTRIIGIILLIIGIQFIFNAFLFNTTSLLNIKIGITSALIGFLMIFLITGESTFKGISDMQITLVMTIWILLMFFITGNASLEIFFTTVILGLLVIKELTDEFTNLYLKKRINIFIFIFFLLFIVIAGERIVSILNI